ncbi:halocarboxylic acid dehydrogenase DehI family protein [Cesiribacter sp. SM1]|uniref:halocarboxylic acid dehydrogenase DehI family protein n=1 Tax=Cesiribacter sp. SM1 TaxID=2861196 RepID=UPI001CD49796|nr:halocarboxylic acid dehydrogenase DehI family protein [Cesiribacter sp. SM1]
MRDLQERNKLISQGMQLAALLPDIMPDDADSQIKPIYEDIQNTLRVPLVNQLFRTLANYPDYLEQLWKHFSPAFVSNSFELEADNLREKALLEDLPEMPEGRWDTIPNAEQLRAFNDTIFYVLPKLLITANIFYEATFSTIPAYRTRRGEAPVNNSPIQTGVAAGTTKVELMKPESADPVVKALFTDIKQHHNHSLVASYYRGVANWPEFLQQAWHDIKPLIGSTAYENLRGFITDQATLSLRKIPLEQPAAIPLDEKQREEVRAILAFFRYKFIPELLLDVALFKAMLDGPAEAYSSRFSVAVSDED